MIDREPHGARGAAADRRKGNHGSWRALTAAPLDTAPRPVLAMAFVNAFRTELLAPAVDVEVAALPAPLVPARPAMLIALEPAPEPVLGQCSCRRRKP